MATKRKKITRREVQKLSSEENKLNVNMLLLVYFTLFALMALDLYIKYKG